MRTLSKYLKVYGVFLKNSVMSQMEYRVNFISRIVMEFVYLIIKILYVLVIGGVGASVSGITADSMLIYVGTYSILTGLYCAVFYVNFSRISSSVRTGELDLWFVKPMSLQFLITTRHFDVGLPIPNVLGGAILVGLGYRNSGIPFSALTVAGYILFLLLGLALIYCVFLIPHIVCFWMVNTTEIGRFSNTFWDINNVPMDIFPSYVKRFLSFGIPVFLMVNLGPQYILGTLKPFSVALVLIMIALWWTISRLVWKAALRCYSSVNS